MTVSGVVASGIGRCQTAGGALHAVLVRVAWFPLLHKLHTIAKTHRALLLDQEANETAKFHMKTQCVDCVGESMVFELLGERDSEVEGMAGPAGDEWMYILERAAVDPVGIAVAMCKRGEYSEALNSLQKLAAQAEPSAMVRRLERKVRRCQEGQVPPERFPHFEFAEEVLSLGGPHPPSENPLQTTEQSLGGTEEQLVEEDLT